MLTTQSRGGDFLADQPPILEMCLCAPRIIRMMERFGCPFNRTPEGSVDFRRFGGTLYHRTAFCGASTGQQLLYSLKTSRCAATSRLEKWRSLRTMSFCALCAITRGERGGSSYRISSQENSRCSALMQSSLEQAVQVLFSKVDELDLLYRSCKWQALHAGNALRKRRVHPNSSYSDSSH